MRGLIVFGILLIAIAITGGCIFQTENSVPLTNPPPSISSEPDVHTGGSALAIAFKGDEISTKSPEAREQFITGLTYLTQYARYNESLEFFDAALAIDQNFSEAWLAKAVAFHNMKQYDDAIRCYNKALELSPGDAGTWSLKAVTLRDSSKANESAECFRRAGELDPRYGNG